MCGDDLKIFYVSSFVVFTGVVPVWNQVHLISTSDDAPQRRYGHAMAAFNSTVYCFGGGQNSSIPFNDLWALTLSHNGSHSGGAWRQLCQNCGSKPPAAFFAAMTITRNLTHHSIYVHGGKDIATNIFSSSGSCELWRIDISSDNGTEIGEWEPVCSLCYLPEGSCVYSDAHHTIMGSIDESIYIFTTSALGTLQSFNPTQTNPTNWSAVQDEGCPEYSSFMSSSMPVIGNSFFLTGKGAVKSSDRRNLHQFEVGTNWTQPCSNTDACADGYEPRNRGGFAALEDSLFVYTSSLWRFQVGNGEEQRRWETLCNGMIVFVVLFSSTYF